MKMPTLLFVAIMMAGCSAPKGDEVENAAKDKLDRATAAQEMIEEAQRKAGLQIQAQTDGESEEEEAEAVEGGEEEIDEEE